MDKSNLLREIYVHTSIRKKCFRSAGIKKNEIRQSFINMLRKEKENPYINMVLLISINELFRVQKELFTI